MASPTWFGGVRRFISLLRMRGTSDSLPRAAKLLSQGLLLSGTWSLTQSRHLAPKGLLSFPCIWSTAKWTAMSVSMLSPLPRRASSILRVAAKLDLTLCPLYFCGRRTRRAFWPDWWRILEQEWIKASMSAMLGGTLMSSTISMNLPARKEWFQNWFRKGFLKRFRKPQHSSFKGWYWKSHWKNKGNRDFEFFDWSFSPASNQLGISKKIQLPCWIWRLPVPSQRHWGGHFGLEWTPHRTPEHAPNHEHTSCGCGSKPCLANWLSSLTQFQSKPSRLRCHPPNLQPSSGRWPFELGDVELWTLPKQPERARITTSYVSFFWNQTCKPREVDIHYWKSFVVSLMWFIHRFKKQGNTQPSPPMLCAWKGLQTAQKLWTSPAGQGTPRSKSKGSHQRPASRTRQPHQASQHQRKHLEAG